LGQSCNLCIPYDYSDYGPRTPAFRPPIGPCLPSELPYNNAPFSAPSGHVHCYPGLGKNPNAIRARRTNPADNLEVELEMEKRHEYSVIKIPRREVDDLFDENVQTMPEEDRRIVLPEFSFENLNWVKTKE
jgi:hypothetical protein